MKVRDKNFGIETPGETIYFKMVRLAMKTVPFRKRVRKFTLTLLSSDMNVF